MQNKQGLSKRQHNISSSHQPDKLCYLFSAGYLVLVKVLLQKCYQKKISAVYLRVDTVEQAIRSVSEQNQKIGPEGYFVLYELTRENLQLGSTVVTDSVNDIILVRNTFRDIAISLNVPFLEIEIICSDKEQHRYRVENRKSDIPGLTPPDWVQVQHRDYEPWDREHLQLDTAMLSATACVDKILAITEPDKIVVR